MTINPKPALNLIQPNQPLHNPNLPSTNRERQTMMTLRRRQRIPHLLFPHLLVVTVHMCQARTARNHRSYASLREEGGVALVPRPVVDGQTAQHVSTDPLGQCLQPGVRALGVG